MPPVNIEMIGQTLGRDRYRITSRLGDGGMGSVYRAWDTTLETDVVVKVPRRSLIEEDREFGQRFQREIRSLVQLSHPHVVRILDVGEHDGLPFAVMQLLGGGSLEQRRRRDAQGRTLPLAPLTLHEWLLPIAQALDYIHSRGYVHRDIKPANILFDSINHPFLSDFGLAKVVAAGEASQASGMTRTGMVLGTPHYMAPELVLAKAYDGRVDQYALAVTVHELLCCRMPIDAATPAAVLVQQVSKPAMSLVQMLPRIDNGFANALLRALEKSPDDRYPTCTEFAAALLHAAGAKPKPGDPPAVTVGRITSSDDGQIPCPSCEKLIRLSEKARGKRTWCPGCRVALQISSDLRELRELVEALPLVYHEEPTSVPDADSPGLATPSDGSDDWQTRALSKDDVQRALSKEPANPAPIRSSRKLMLPLMIASAVMLGLVVGGLVWRESNLDDLASSSTNTGTDAPAAPLPAMSPVKPILTPILDREIAFDEVFVVSLKLENATEVGTVRYEWDSPPPISAQLDPDTGVITSDPSFSRPAGSHVLKLRAVQVRSETPSDISAVVVKIKSLDLPDIKPVPSDPYAGETVKFTLPSLKPGNPSAGYHYRLRSTEPWQPLKGNEIELKDVTAGNFTVNVQLRTSSDALLAEKSGSFTVEELPSIRPIQTPAEPIAGDKVSIKLVGATAKGGPLQFEWRLATQTEWRDDIDGDELNLPELPAGDATVVFRGKIVRDVYTPERRHTLAVVERAVRSDTMSTIGLKLVLIRAGAFQMGSPAYESERGDDEILHEVKLTRPYYLGVYEVTQSEYKRVMDRNPSIFSSVSGQNTDRFPVEKVSWFDAIDFCNVLSRIDGLPEYYKVSKMQVSINGGAGYRLPTEAEWEYACRAGSRTSFSFGDILNGQLANVDGGTPYGTKTNGPFLKRTTTVGSYEPNAFGLYDMHGNVWEWCFDSHGVYPSHAVTDPKGPNNGHWNVRRGGAWNDIAMRARTAFRGTCSPSMTDNSQGFRVARTPSTP
jgi:formylglycine-generating enzyme required for sulfatase activity